MSELVTGEAVVLGLRPAKLASRAIAVAIDLVVWWGTYLVVSMGLAFATASLDTAAVAAVTVATMLLILVGLPVCVETLSKGRSLGKLVCGLRVVRDDGGPIRFRHALVRGAVGAVEIQMSMGTIACIASLVSARGRRLGDVFAGTLVVRERVPAHYMQQPAPPPRLAGQVSGIDLSGVPDELWLAVRQYLARMRQLDPQVSWSMAERLAGDVAARTGKAVPQGASPAEYLAAVVAERQSRDVQRVFGNGGADAGHPAPGAGTGPGSGAGSGRSGGDMGGHGPDGGGGGGRGHGSPDYRGAGQGAASDASRGWAAPGGDASAVAEPRPVAGGIPVPPRGAHRESGNGPAAEDEAGRRTGFAPPA